MVKFGRAKEQARASTAPTPHSSNLICYICGASNANWPVYSRIRGTHNSPFFPFLEYQDPPPGCRVMDRRTGRVDACTVCFSFLTQQWHAYEANNTPLIKRLYWLKRSGMDSSSEKKEGSHSDHNAVNAEELHKALSSLNEERSFDGSSSQKDESETHSELSESRDMEDDKCDNLPASEENSPTRNLSADHANAASRIGAVAACFICGREKAKEFIRSVHTRPQLKTETPFYPCLARHTPVGNAQEIDYLGKALVCEACQKFLFRQWQVFQKNRTPLGERQYQLRSDPSLPQDQQSHLSTMVCFVCGVNQPATSGRFLYSRKHSPGEPYFRFLEKLAPPMGAMPLTQQGLTRVCSGCRKSLHRQWKQYETDRVEEGDRRYHIRSDTTAVVSEKGFSSFSSTVACFTCGNHFSGDVLCHLYTRPNTNPANGALFFPFVANLKPPPDAPVLDQSGRALVCRKCGSTLNEKWFVYEKNGTPFDDRVYDFKQGKSQEVICFLCGNGCSGHLAYAYPQPGKGVEDGGPFFPFLSSHEPALNARAVDSQGAVSTCEICFTNLMTQWNSYESSKVPEENNRWVRKYTVAHVVCYLCGKKAQRSISGAVNESLITFSKNHHPPRGALCLERKRVVLCSDCLGHVKSDLEAMEDKQAGSGGRRKKGTLDLMRDALPSSDPVIVIDSSDGENESFTCLKSKQSSLAVPASHTNEPPMHYMTSTSPGVQQSMLQNRDRLPSVSPPSMRSGSNSREASFSAALRNLAKQAVTPLAHSPVSSNSGSQSPSPALPAATSKNAGMSPSRNSPAARQGTPPSSSFLDSKSKDRRELPHQVVGRVHSPSAPNSKFESEHRNQAAGDPTHDPSRGPLGPEMGLHRVGHQVMPGVYSTKPHSGAPRDVAMLSEHYPPNHHPPHVAFYMHHGGKSEAPMFVPRGVPGPPPLLASKRDGLDHPPVVHPFYPGPYRTPVLDPNDLSFPTWRQQRAAEHLRQQHDRQALFGDDYAEPFDRPLPPGVEQDRHLPPGAVELHSHSMERSGGTGSESSRQRTDGISEAENKKQEAANAPSSADNRASETGGEEGGKEKPNRGNTPDAMPMIRQVYYNSAKTSCPVHGHGTGPSRMSPTEPPRTSHPSHAPPPGSEPLPGSKPGRPDEPNRMFLPPHEPPLLPPYLMHPRDAPPPPYPLHPLDKRQADYFREQGRQQELYFHQHALRDQKDQAKAREEDWHVRPHPRQPHHHHHHHQQQQQQQQQHEQQQDKDAANRESGRYAHPLHRQAPDYRDRPRKSPFSAEPHKPEAPSLRERDFLRAYSLPPYYPSAAHDGVPAKPFGDHFPRGVDHHVLRGPDARHASRSAHHDLQFPVGRFPAGFQDPYPFFPEGFPPGTAMADRAFAGRIAWQRRDRAAIRNGDFPPDLSRSQLHPVDPTGMTRAIKIERIEEDTSLKRPALRIRHSPSKLRFLEGLGLVTVDRKQEMSLGEPGLKRKYDHLMIENEAEGIENKENESPLDARTDNDSADGDTPQSRAEKLEFMAKLGLVPPSQRQELEKTFEVRRSERKTRKSRGRPPKRARRDGEGDRDSDNSQGSNVDLENTAGPITRQKQQLLQEQGILQEQKKSKDNRPNISKELSVQIKTESTEKSASVFSFEPRSSYRGNGTEQYRNSPTVTSSERHGPHVPPRLTLQSLTNMEDPFSNVGAASFRPPYLRHTGLLTPLAPSSQHDARAMPHPVRPEPLRGAGFPPGEPLPGDYTRRPSMESDFGRQFSPRGHTQHRASGFRTDEERMPRDQAASDRSSPCDEPFRWPGVEAVMQAYLAHSTERNDEVRVLRDNAEQLQMRQQSLEEEAKLLTNHIENLAHIKQGQAEDGNALLERLHTLHYFIEGFRR